MQISSALILLAASMAPSSLVSGTALPDPVAAALEYQPTHLGNPKPNPEFNPDPKAKANCPPRRVPAQEQARLFASYVEVLYKKQDAVKAFADFVSPSYIQHNPFVADGSEAALAFLKPVWDKQKIAILHQAFDKGSGIGMIHYKDEGFNPNATAIVDIVRMQGSCIVEHWDVVQEVPANATNPHPLF
jgi:predicted SnoaL-like aldol condensation-catalyzing enzyme